MVARFRAEGRTVRYMAENDVPAGTLVKIGTYVGIANNAIGAGKLGDLTICGIVSVPLTLGAISGPLNFGLEMDIDFTNQKLVAGGAGDSDVKVFWADGSFTPEDGVSYDVFLNRVGG